MNFKNLFLFVLIGLSSQTFAQTKPKLATQIEQLANKVISTIHTEDVFLQSGKSVISTDDLKAIKKIVMGNGFPTISMVGKENSHKFWMMVQLCDSDLQFQVAVLKQMDRANRKSDVIKEDYAMLTDRTRVNRKIPQLYGTQYFMNDFGDLTLCPVHDEIHINERRKTLRLSKISEAETKVKDVIANSTKKNEYDDDQYLDDNK